VAVQDASIEHTILNVANPAAPVNVDYLVMRKVIRKDAGIGSVIDAGIGSVIPGLSCHSRESGNPFIQLTHSKN
jgi:hypothetical protein